MTIRTSAVREIWISAVLILPAFVLYAVGPYGQAVWWVHLLSQRFLAELYLVAVVAVWGRSARRRILAVVVGLVGILVERGLSATIYRFRAGEHFSSLDFFAGFHYLSSRGDVEGAEALHYGGLDDVMSIFRVSYPAMILFVAAWGIARRRTPWWLLGLLVSFPVIVLAWRAGYETHQLVVEGPWLGNRLFDIGVFVLCCLICWAFDAGGLALRRAGAVEEAGDSRVPWLPLAGAKVGVVVLCAIGYLVSAPPPQPHCKYHADSMTATCG